MRPRHAVALATAVQLALVAHAADFYLGIDVPAQLGLANYTPEQIVRSAGGVYTLSATLATGLQLGALHRRADGSWLFSPAHPVALGGNEYEPRDIVSFDGATYSTIFDGGSAGIPEDARIDALFLESNGDPVLSFDVPVTLGGTTYLPSDLVRLRGSTFSTYWSGSAAGVPSESNVVGAAIDGAGQLVMTFDIPTIVSGSTFLPGELVRWNKAGGILVSYFVDSSWPPYAQLRDFSFVPSAGEVPQDTDAPGGPLLAAKAAGSDITLTWSASCAASDTDYEVYEGTIALGFASHNPKICSTGGSMTATFTPTPGSSYFLVVPRNAVAEGSHGHRSDGSERVNGGLRCLPLAASACAVNP